VLHHLLFVLSNKIITLDPIVQSMTLFEFIHCQRREKMVSKRGPVVLDSCA